MRSTVGTLPLQNKYGYIFYMLCSFVILSFVGICILQFLPTTIILFPQQSSSSSIISQSSSKSHADVALAKAKATQEDNYNTARDDDDLEVALAKAATQDKTVIIALVNKAYVEEGDKPMFDIFLDGFWLGDGTRDLIKHLLIVAVDQTSYDRCLFLRLHCYKLQTEGVDFAAEEEMQFMSLNFVKLVWRRIQFLGDVAKHGYNFIFTDTDVLWLRNPFSKLKMDEGIDLQISTDYYVYKERKDLQEKYVNTGFYMLRSNNKTIAFLDAWHANQDYNLKEQDVLVNLLMINDDTSGLGLAHKLDLKLHFLDTLYFSGFCENSHDIAQVITVHANCCNSITAKAVDLTAILHDWKKTYNNKTASPTTDHHHTSSTTTFKWSKHAACINASNNFYNNSFTTI